jgi:hypothetical protein
MAATTSRSKLAGKRVRIAIDPNAKANEIESILKRIYGISGCPECGRGGYDILLTHSLPALEPIKALDRVQGIVTEEINAGL